MSYDRSAGTEVVTTDRTGIMIIRAWVEHGSSEPLRAQIRVTTDVSAGIQRTLALATAEDVSATVSEWLNGIVRDGVRQPKPRR